MTFGTERRADRRRSGDNEPAVGDRVLIVTGRHRGSAGKLFAYHDAPTPSGSNVRLAVVERPRAGLTLVFSHEIEKAQE